MPFDINNFRKLKKHASQFAVDAAKMLQFRTTPAAPSAATAGPAEKAPQPTEIRLSADNKILRVLFPEKDGKNPQKFELPAEFLRVESPSAEVKGHGHGQSVLVSGKRDVVIQGIAPYGNYAIQLTFSDGHKTGIYSWDYLYTLGKTQKELWLRYMEKLDKAGLSRRSHPLEPAESIAKKTVGVLCAAGLSVLLSLSLFGPAEAAKYKDVAVNSLEITKAWSRATTPAMRTGVVYMTLRNEGATPLKVTGATSSVSERVVFHRTEHADHGQMKMEMIEDIPLPANGEVRLQPGGLHMMLLGLKQQLESGRELGLTLLFENGTKRHVKVDVKELSYVPPAASFPVK